MQFGLQETMTQNKAKNLPKPKSKQQSSSGLVTWKEETENTKDAQNLHLNFATIFDKGNDSDGTSKTEWLVNDCMETKSFLFQGKNTSFTL